MPITNRTPLDAYDIVENWDVLRTLGNKITVIENYAQKVGDIRVQAQLKRLQGVSSGENKVGIPLADHNHQFSTYYLRLLKKLKCPLKKLWSYRAGQVYYMSGRPTIVIQEVKDYKDIKNPESFWIPTFEDFMREGGIFDQLNVEVSIGMATSTIWSVNTQNYTETGRPLVAMLKVAMRELFDSLE